jgi:bifunctional DNA-binding transcriptional regulator/antitoxin component of YhaV-PrlF toxin-antitoxin module
MAMSTTVGTKGRVTIEKGIRKVLGIQPGWRAIQRLEGDRVVIRFRPPKHRDSLLGMLGGADLPRPE